MCHCCPISSRRVVRAPTVRTAKAEAPAAVLRRAETARPTSLRLSPASTNPGEGESKVDRHPVARVAVHHQVVVDRQRVAAARHLLVQVADHLAASETRRDFRSLDDPAVSPPPARAAALAAEAQAVGHLPPHSVLLWLQKLLPHHRPGWSAGDRRTQCAWNSRAAWAAAWAEWAAVTDKRQGRQGETSRLELVPPMRISGCRGSGTHRRCHWPAEPPEAKSFRKTRVNSDFGYAPRGRCSASTGATTPVDHG